MEKSSGYWGERVRRKRPGDGDTLRLLANLLGYEGDNAQSVQLLERALRSLKDEPKPDPVEYGAIQIGLASKYLDMGELGKAESFSARAVRTLESAGAPGEVQLAKALTSCGEVAETMGELEGAENAFGRALRLRERVLGPDDGDTAQSMAQLAELYTRREDFARAEPLYVRSLAIQEKVFDPTEQFKMFWTLEGLGLLEGLLGKFDRAEVFLERALDTLDGASSLRDREASRVAIYLAWVYAAKGDCQKAENCLHAPGIFEHCLASADRLGGDNLRFLAQLQADFCNRAAALALAEQVQISEEKRLAQILSLVSEGQRLDALKFYSQARFTPWGTLGAPNPLARAILRTKGVVLDSLLEDRLLAQGTGDVNLRQLVAQLTAARQRFSGLSSVALGLGFGSRVPGDRSAELESLTREIGSLEASLASKITGFGQARRALSIRVADIQAAIPDGTALLEMISYKDAAGQSYGVLVLSSSTDPKWVSLGRADLIEKNIHLFGHLIRYPGPGDALSTVLRDLHDQLWQPLKQALPVTARRIIISPDRELDYVSFATLLTPEKRILG